MNHCLSFCLFYFGHCIVWSFDLWLLITPIVSSIFSQHTRVWPQALFLSKIDINMNIAAIIQLLEAHEMLIQFEFNVKSTFDTRYQNNQGRDSKLVRHFKFGNVLPSTTTCIHVTYNNVCITEPIINVSSLSSLLSSMSSQSSIITISIVYVLFSFHPGSIFSSFFLYGYPGFISRDLYYCFYLALNSNH